jgi:hypothetical protein
MRLFLSWSDKTSRKVAEALYDWLPYIIQAINPFISSGEIDKGLRWSEELKNQLKQASYGIICLTRHNINAPWMNFEAGAISNVIQHSRVSPFLFHVESAQVSGPLQEFQFTVYGKNDGLNKKEVFKLVESINNTFEPTQQVPQERLRRQFEKWWADLKAKLDEILPSSEVENVDGFRWLFLREDIVSLQDSVECQSVWVIASTLYPYSLEADLRDLVQSNMKRKVVYTYIIPESQENVPFVQEFVGISTKNGNKPIVCSIPEEDFNKFAAADYLIVNPECSNSYQVRMFLELPIKCTERYWIEVDEEATVKFVARFGQLAKRGAGGPDIPSQK